MTGLEVHGLGRTIAGRTIIAGVDFAVPSGDRLALVGPSGGGKTTILRLIGGFDRVDAGYVEVGGRRLSDSGAHVAPRLRRVGYVPQEGALFPHLTAAANMTFGVPRRARGGRGAALAELVGLDPALLDRYPHELSGGQQQRVALGRALAARPDVVLLDEPFSALDAALRVTTRDAVVATLERAGTTAVLVTHDRSEALHFGDQVGVVVDGRIAQLGQPTELLDHPATPAVFRLLGPMTTLRAVRDGPAARTSIGPITITNDRSHCSDEVVVALRPSQVQIRPDGVANAQVLDRQDDVDSVRLRLQVTSGYLDAEVDRWEASGVHAGSAVAVAVRGSASLFSRASL